MAPTHGYDFVSSPDNGVRAAPCQVTTVSGFYENRYNADQVPPGLDGLGP